MATTTSSYTQAEAAKVEALYLPLLRKIDAGKRLFIDAPVGKNTHGWGRLSRGEPISYAIIAIWQQNDCLMEDGDFWVLSDIGQRAIRKTLTKTEIAALRVSQAIYVDETTGGSIQVEDQVLEGMLFTKQGACRLCGKKMEVFGQISHAK